MGYFSGVGEAEADSRNKFVSPGLHVFEVTKCSLKKLRKSKKQNLIVEAKTISSTNEAEHPKGSKVSIFIDLEHDMTTKNLKSLGLAILGISKDDKAKVDAVSKPPVDKDGKPLKDKEGKEKPPIIEAAWDAAIDANAFLGKRFSVDAQDGETKEGKPHTFLNYDVAPQEAA